MSIPLLPVLPPGLGVCAVCAGSVPAGWPRCLPCRRNAERLPVGAAAVSAVALAPAGSPLARALAGYKNAPRATDRADRRDRLAALLAAWLDRHERCLAAAAGVAGFPVVASVPSGRGRAPHPLETVVSVVAAARWRPALRPAGGGRRRAPAPGRFRAEVPPAAPVLLVDDTWTTGASAQSAAAALRAAGAGPVGILVLGRHLAVTGLPTRRAAAAGYLRAAAARGWDAGRCRHCADDRPVATRGDGAA